MGLFDKKFCSICGEKIGLLGNRKLEDGNLCKNCAAKLSPFFSERRSSTVDEIKEQLAYREQNRENLRSFHTTRTINAERNILLDEDNKKFVISNARDLIDANPDIIDYEMVTGATLDISERKDELKWKNKEGQMVSYNPPKYEFDYDFHVNIDVNHPYFNRITVDVNNSSITCPQAKNAMRLPGQAVATTVNSGAARPEYTTEYREAEKKGKEIVRLLTSMRTTVRRDMAAAARAAEIAKKPVICPFCGATTVPDANGCCEYCGSPVR